MRQKEGKKRRQKKYELNILGDTVGDSAGGGMRLISGDREGPETDEVLGGKTELEEVTVDIQEGLKELEEGQETVDMQEGKRQSSKKDK